MLAAKLFAMAMILALPEIVFSDPHKLVYRYDLRHPNHVLYRGFSAHGSNMDILQHLSGHSCRDKTSGFISTTGRRQFAENILNHALYRAGRIHSKSFTGYVYAIRATDNFYSALASINRLMERQSHLSFPDSILDAIRVAEEYIVPQEISPSLIYSVSEYVYDHFYSGGGIVRHLSDTLSPLYVDNISSRLNPGPFIQTVPALRNNRLVKTFTDASYCFTSFARQVQGCINHELEDDFDLVL